MKRTRLRAVSLKRRRGGAGRHAAMRHVLARITMAPVGHCEYAGGTSHWGDMEIHHVVKRSQGGTDEPSNLLRLCQRHHAVTDSAYAVGRLVVTRLGEQRFLFEEVWALSKWDARARA